MVKKLTKLIFLLFLFFSFLSFSNLKVNANTENIQPYQVTDEMVENLEKMQKSVGRD